MKNKKQKENWEKELWRIICKYIQDADLDMKLEDFIRQERAKDHQKFIEILEELNEFVETESGKSGRKEILQKIQEVIKQLKDKK